MAVTQNLKGTSYPSFKIHKSGPTLYQGSVAPTQSAVNGDLFLQHGSDGALWIYDNGSWGQVGASGTSTDTTTIINSSNSGSQVQQFVLFGETSDGNEHILAPTSAFSIDTTSTTIDSILTTLDTGSTSGVIGIPANSAGMFEVRVVARDAANNNNAGYKCTGVIVNDNGTTTLLADPTESIIGESNSEWYAVCESQDNGNDSLIIKVSGSANTTVRWTAFVTLTLVNHVTPTYALSASSNSIDEGGTVDITLTTTSLADGMTAAYTVTGVDANDLSAGNLTGVFTINSNSATASFTLAEDVTTEGAETLTLALDNGLASIDVVVNDTSGTPTYTLSADNTTINEGGTVTVTLTTTYVADSTTVAYTVTGVDANDLSAGSLTGNFTISGGTGTAVFTLAEDVTTEGAETLTLTLDNGEGSIDITVTDSSTAPIVASPTVPSTSVDVSDTDLLNGISGSPTLSSSFASDIRIDTNGTYSIVSDMYLSPDHNGDTIDNAGWAWIIRNSDGAIMKSWNSMLDGDAPDDASLATETNSDTGVNSKYHLAMFGWACAINDNYAFVGAVYRPRGIPWTNNNHTAGRGYVFAIRLSDFTVAHVFEVPAGLNSSGSSSSGGTGWIEQGIVATNDTLVISANRHDKYNDDYSTGAITVHDISDATPSNWTTTVIESPIDTRTEPTWSSPNGRTYGNTSFGASVDIVGDKIVVAHTHWLHIIEKTNNTWSITSSTREVYQESHGASPRSFLTADGNTWVRTDDAAGSFIAFDLTNNLTQLYTKTISTTNGNPGYALHRDGNYIYAGDSWHDGTVTDEGVVLAYNVSDGSDVLTIPNPTPANTRFGTDMAIKDLKLVSRVRPNGTGYGLVFMDLYSAPAVNVVSNDITNFTVDTGGTFSADANGLRPHGSSVNNWYGNSGLSFNDDGTQMYWKETSSWYGFTLSTPYDTGTAVRDTSLDPYNYGQSNPFQFYSDHTYTVNYHTWSGDGRRYFLSGGSTKGAGWDIRTTDSDYSLDGVQNIGHDGSAETSYNFSFFSTFVPDALGNADNVMSNSNILFFNNDGTKLYMAKWESGYLSGYVTQYDLTTPYTCDVSYAYGSFTSIHTQHLLTQPDATVTQGSQNENGTLEDVKWSSDGTKLFMLCESNIYDWVEGVETKRGPTIYQVDCSTPYDIATASYTQGNHIVLREAGIDTNGCYPSMAVEGNNIWVNVNAPTITGDSNTYTGRCLVKLTAPTPGGGSGGGGSTIDQLTVSPNYTMSDLYANLGIGSTTFTWGDNGNTFMVSLIYGPTGYFYYRFELTTPYDLTTATYADTAQQGWVGHGESVGFSNDGMKFYIERQGAIVQYNLSTAYTVGQYSGTNVAATLGTILATGSAYKDWFWNSDGTKIYVADGTARTFKEFTLSSAWELSTASHTATYDFSTDIPSGTIKGMVGVSDLSKFYVLASTRIIYEFAMSSAGDITTTSLTASLDITNDISDPDHMKIKHDDTVLYIMGSGSELYTITL